MLGSAPISEFLEEAGWANCETKNPPALKESKAEYMNPAEKIAATYLRLNGFLLLPHFTMFGGGYHNHVDLLGLRAPHSIERTGYATFPTDDEFFKAIPGTICKQPREVLLGALAEARTNTTRDHPNEEQMEYVQFFLGDATIVPMAFSDSAHPPHWVGLCLEIGNRHAINWIIQRIRWMDNHHEGLTKTGSWPWSEDALADLLVLHKYGAFGRSGEI